MSLLDRGPHTVTVYPQHEVVDWRGNPDQEPVTSGPVTVAGCLMQPVSSSRGTDFDEGQRVTVEYRLIARSAPAGPWAAVEWVDPVSSQTRRFIPLGVPSERHYSPASDHITVQLREER